MKNLGWLLVVKKDTVDMLVSVGEEYEHITCFKVITGDSELIIINAYCQYSLTLEGFLDKIEKLLNNFQNEKVLITMDSNTSSEWWFDKVTDGKEILLEEFIYE